MFQPIATQAKLAAPTVPELIGMLVFCGTDGCIASAFSMIRDAAFALLEALPQISQAMPGKIEEPARVVDRRLVGQAVTQMQQDAC